MTHDRHVIALEELAAPLGSLVHAVNNSLGAIATTAYALQMEGGLSRSDADVILGGVEFARARFGDFAPVVAAKSDPTQKWTGPLPEALSGTITALVGRPVRVDWATGTPRARDAGAATRNLVAALWTAASELAAERVLVACDVRERRLLVIVRTADGGRWGPVDIGEAA